MTETGPSLAVDELSQKYWITILCKKGFQFDALLYNIFMISALHTEKRSNSSDQEAVQNCRTYLNMAIREHHKDIAQMSQDNVDIICLTSSMLRLYSLRPEVKPEGSCRMGERGRD
ncbi:hypothetical protein BGZ61DRAFT_540940 [Ilyonectria robusta]|uniref:uncharacterized protein n=1 Tax=Ilyonectria robusta TaxID=1079257 RepID=UPI001E8EEF3D|nr:uncharacterized protein BGZ61DRAFT_540940 [Ilyonectria robusta]KAH8656370.1 hypothetical protein BGZ61DRAFT_540940 [Ilyonectria robusta]